MKILLDTSLVLRLASPRNAAALAVTNALDRLGSNEWSCVIVPQVVYECWVVLTRPHAQNGFGFAADQASEEVEKLVGLFPLLKDERGIYAQWLQLVLTYKVHGKNGHDARLVAAMLRHGVTHILTLNPKDFQRYSEIVVYSPETLPADLTNL